VRGFFSSLIVSTSFVSNKKRIAHAAKGAKLCGAIRSTSSHGAHTQN